MSVPAIQEHLEAIVQLAAKPKKCDGAKDALAPEPPIAGDKEKHPKGAQVMMCGCGKSLKSGETCKKCGMSGSSKSSIFCPIEKSNDEEQTVTGVVLQPEVTDGQGDIYDADVVKQAAYGFLMNFNQSTELGLQHKEFKKGRFALVESYLAPMEMAIGSRTVKAGSWIMTVKVLDSKIWKLVKDGKITGFSIGGKAQVQQLSK